MLPIVALTNHLALTNVFCALLLILLQAAAAAGAVIQAPDLSRVRLVGLLRLCALTRDVKHPETLRRLAQYGVSAAQLDGGGASGGNVHLAGRIVLFREHLERARACVNYVSRVKEVQSFEELAALTLPNTTLTVQKCVPSKVLQGIPAGAVQFVPDNSMYDLEDDRCATLHSSRCLLKPVLPSPLSLALSTPRPPLRILALSDASQTSIAATAVCENMNVPPQKLGWFARVFGFPVVSNICDGRNLMAVLTGRKCVRGVLYAAKVSEQTESIEKWVLCGCIFNSYLVSLTPFTCPPRTEDPLLPNP